MRKKLLRLLAVLAALSMVAAACGGDDGGDTASGDDTAAETSDDAGDGDDEEAMEDEEGEEAMEDEDGEAMAEGGELTDVGVTDDEIRLGLISDLTGPFAGLTGPITDGLEAYWENVNENGGVAGRQVVLEIRDASYDIDIHGTFYDELADDGDDGVAMLQMNLGSPMTAAHREDFVDDSIAAIPLSWNSSWSTQNGSNIFEWGTNYCVEGMNGIEWMATNRGVSNVAVIGYPGDYGEDGSFGAKRAIDDLSLSLAFDGQGQVIPGADFTPVAQSIVDSGADLVWATVGPTDLGALMGRAAELGYQGQWAGNGPSFNQALLNTALGPILDANYTHFGPLPSMDPAQSAGMAEIVEIMQERRPDAPYFGVYAMSYVMGEMARQALQTAHENGDLTRQGIVDAFTATTIDTSGMTSAFGFEGDPNDVIPRETFVFDIDTAVYDAEATMTSGIVGSDGLILVDTFQGDVATGFTYEPCFGI